MGPFLAGETTSQPVYNSRRLLMSRRLHVPVVQPTPRLGGLQQSGLLSNYVGQSTPQTHTRDELPDEAAGV